MVSNLAKKVGAVMVVGGGIGGMQSALDLANSGFKVYLLEETPSIGGVMAQLDKTFPTNDCSMCIMSPKMVDVGRHPNIELLSYSELESVKGKEGHYKVKVKRKARSIDETKCTGCGVCIENCPVKLEIQIPEKPKKAPKVRDKKFIDELVVKHAEMKRPLVQIMLDVNER
jgi:heterodisulfide reductase subunit A